MSILEYLDACVRWSSTAVIPSTASSMHLKYVAVLVFQGVVSWLLEQDVHPEVLERVHGTVKHSMHPEEVTALV